MDVVDKLNAEYGEGAPRGRGPDQGRIQTEGNAYLTKDFGKLDYVKKATIEKIARRREAAMRLGLLSWRGPAGGGAAAGGGRSPGRVAPKGPLNTIGGYPAGAARLLAMAAGERGPLRAWR